MICSDFTLYLVRPTDTDTNSTKHGRTGMCGQVYAARMTSRPIYFTVGIHVQVVAQKKISLSTY